MNKNTTTQAAPTTKREAGYLNSLRDAAEAYNRSLATLADSIKREQDLLKDGYQTSGIGSQWLIEAATKQATLKAVLDGQYNACETEDRDVWQDLVQQAYKQEVRWFSASGE